MTAEPVRYPDLGRVLGALSAVGLDLDPIEFADACWLAAAFAAPPEAPPAATEPAAPAQPTPPAKDGSFDTSSGFKDVNTLGPGSAAHQKEFLYALRREADASGSLVFLPDASALSDNLALGRALRPLRRRVDSWTQMQVDEVATAKLTAVRRLAWSAAPLVPAFRPTRTRWLDAVLLVDRSQTMAVWRRTIEEWALLLQQLGAFRDVRIWHLIGTAGEPALVSPCDDSASSGVLHHNSELMDPSGRRLVLIASDCIGPLWSTAAMADFLAVQAATGPFAILQVLPPHMWRRTALAHLPSYSLSARTPGLPAHRLDAVALDPEVTDDEPVEQRPAIPVVPLRARALAAWTKLVLGAPSGRAAGYRVVTAPSTSKVEARVSAIDTATLVHRFLAGSSTTARRLATYLAAVPLTAPVMRLVRQELVPEAHEEHLIEVLFSGLVVQRVPDLWTVAADEELYDFYPGVREQLIAGLSTATLESITQQIGEYLERTKGAAYNFFAALRSPVQPEGAMPRPFATVSAALANVLGNMSPVGATSESSLPSEVLASRDTRPGLAALWRNRVASRRDALRPLNEAKLIVVGNEAVGKTSLIRYLVHGQPRDPDERKTPGTAIHEKIEVSAWSVHQSQVHLNVWDFGGQEIMRGTHRFFLTERSLYLLVLEDRREDDRSIYEWLEIIAQYGGNSPVIIVVNKSDGEVSQRRLDEAALRRAYPVIAGFARTSCNPTPLAATSIAALRAQIVATLSESPRLKHVRDPIPQSWLRVKDEVAALARARSALPVRDFERLCEGDAATPASERITDLDEQRVVLRLLHDLGAVVAHGLRSDAPAVWQEITVLDPNWLTGAIYALINSPTVRDQKGELRHDQLGELLDPARYPARWHELIINIMQEPALGLCFPLSHNGSPRYLLPDALPVSEPDYGVWPSDSLRFRLQYSILPTGLISRFIVEAHRNLTDRPTWWRTGVVLGAEGCRILVRGDTAKNRVEILVVGVSGQRAALSVVRDYFEAVHRHHYAKLTVSARVPLPDQPDVDVGYDYLITLEQEEGPDHAFRPEGAHRKYTVRELLEGVRDDGPLRRRRRTDERADGAHGAHDLGERPPAPRPARPSTSPYRGKIDFGILTIREDENAAVLRRFPKLATDEQRRRYRIRSLVLPGGGSYTLAVLRCLEQGNTDALSAANTLLEDLSPRFLLVIGIAGAVPSHELTLGDVVVSSRIADFSVEAVIRNEKPEYALGGGPLHPHAAKLAADISAMVIDGELEDWNSPASLTRPRPPVPLTDDRFYGTDDWKKSVREKLHRHFAAAPPRPPLATTGAIASSDRLIKDDELLSVWLKIARQVVAVEMESAGIYKASHERGVPFLAIRGISDVVGFKRDPDWTAYACETAAAFAHAFLRARPIEPLS